MLNFIVVVSSVFIIYVSSLSTWEKPSHQVLGKEGIGQKDRKLAETCQQEGRLCVDLA